MTLQDLQDYLRRRCRLPELVISQLHKYTGGDALSMCVFCLQPAILQIHTSVPIGYDWARCADGKVMICDDLCACEEQVRMQEEAALREVRIPQV